MTAATLDTRAQQPTTEPPRSDGEVQELVAELTGRAKAASRVLAVAPTARKNAALERAAAALETDAVRAAVSAANADDLARAAHAQLAPALVDRLVLNEARMDAMVAGLRQVAALPDPVGALVQHRRLESGLEVARMRVPLGLIGIVYESRPNVTVDAAALCVKSGNAVVLRGGKEAFASNGALAAVFEDALRAEGLPPEAVTLVPTTDRRATKALIGLEGVVDLAIPRGGTGLIRFVTEHARVPVIQHYQGVCHVYVDAGADLDKALAIAVNAKTQRPGVCNAMETLLVDAAVAPAFLPRLAGALDGVTLHADARALPHLPGAEAAGAEAFGHEYLALELAVAVVDGLDGALAHVARHGSQHTEAIVTESYATARRWVREVDASCVLVNASTRFNDGFQLGLGAEMGISTTKLHAYGPMGLEELCALKWVGFGEGHVRS
ncbi:MAG: glutamate-5-semialdehyde dehydrogenase [Myxococcota bacterium]